MENNFIMTAFGEDRPGIVSDVTEILYEHGCNLKDTSMTLLVDEFTLILHFTCDREDVLGVLEKECRRLEREKGVSAFIRSLGKDPLPKKEESFTSRIQVEGLDHSGIVFKVSKFLAENNIGIVDLKSRVKASPESGTALYLMDILVQIPVARATPLFVDWKCRPFMNSGLESLNKL